MIGHVIAYVVAVVAFAASIKIPEAAEPMPCDREPWVSDLPSMELEPDSYRDDSDQVEV